MITPIETYSVHELTQITQTFFKDLVLAESGRSKSLNFLLTNIPKSNFLPSKEVFQVMTIGGTNFKSALVKIIKHKKISITKKKEVVLPSFDSVEIFCENVFKNIDSKVTKLAINFAFPVQNITRQNRCDAILLRHTKQHKFEGLVGKNIGETLEKYFHAKLNKKIEVVVVNDIVCLLASINPELEQIAAVIIGTGYNTGFKLGKNQFVNLESGNFNGFVNTQTGALVDKNSNNFSYQYFEKEVSGMYLYKHYNFLNQSNNVLKSSKELNQLAIIGDNTAQSLFDRSASLVATQLAGIYYFFGENKITFAIEGSLFWNGFEYSKSVKKYLKLLDVPTCNIKFVKPKSSFQGLLNLFCKSP